MAVYASTDFTAAREIDGSGARQFSDITTADFIVTRLYVQLASAYKPLPISTADAIYKNAYLVEETEERRQMGHVWFRRVFATVPTSRDERQEMVFTFPGSSAIIETKVNGAVVKRWDKYGRSRPATAPREALVQISYSLGEPSTGLPTQITYDDQPVDFVGRVYTEDGAEYLGTTSPLSSPSTFVISDVARRWRGNIWERQRVSVSKFGGASVARI